tara:strand:- start:421 stop:588 length:168 start_codon:yes stop_codon:yes gene_type:complete
MEYLDYFINKDLNLLYTIFEKNLLVKSLDKKFNKLNKYENEFLRDAHFLRSIHIL